MKRLKPCSYCGKPRFHNLKLHNKLACIECIKLSPSDYQPKYDKSGVRIAKSPLKYDSKGIKIEDMKYEEK